jgi:hypothetical protein
MRPEMEPSVQARGPGHLAYTRTDTIEEHRGREQAGKLRLPALEIIGLSSLVQVPSSPNGLDGHGPPLDHRI